MDTDKRTVQPSAFTAALTDLEISDLKIFDSLSAIISISDIDNYDMAYLNEYGKRSLGIPVEKELIGKCYRIMQNKEYPCDSCTNKYITEHVNYIWRHENEINKICYLAYDQTVTFQGKPMRLEIAFDISGRENIIGKIIGDLNTEERIVGCVRMLSSPGGLKTSVEMVLNTLLDFYRGDRVYIMEIDENASKAFIAYELCADGIDYSDNFCQDIPLDDMKQLIKNFKSDKVIRINHGYPLCEAYVVAAPYWEDGLLRGFIGVENPEEEVDLHLLEELCYFTVSEIRKSKIKADLEILSYYDSLTNLRNRNGYQKYIDEFCQGISAGVLVLNLNGLKTINEQFGHSYGDIVLASIADKLICSFLGHDLFRLNGDEFVAICENCQESEFLEMSEALKKRFDMEDGYSVAVGSIWEANCNNIQSLINKADQFMFLNKQHYYEKIHSSGFPHHKKKLDMLLAAISKDRFLIYLQPKYSFLRKRIYGAEALVRYHNDKDQVIPPDNFIGYMEKEKIISFLDFHVLNKVCGIMTGWMEKEEQPPIISVNFSRISLMEEHVVQNIKNICDRYQVPYSQIHIEITETSETIDRNKLMKVLNELSVSGFAVALDDFGAGFSSLEMLADAKIDILKIDKNLVDRILVSDRNRILVKYTAEICHQMGIFCLTEGIETKEQLKAVKELNCDGMQGYLLNKPIGAEEFEALYIGCDYKFFADL